MLGLVASPSRRRTAYAAFLFAAALTFSVVLTRYNTRQHHAAARLLRRDPGQDCRLVHSAHDRCKFVRDYCPDEEAGLASYLQLYYCTLDGAHWLAFTVMTLWLCLLFSTIGIAASDFFSVNLSTIASLLGLSENLAGVTFLAFGNGSPDVFSTFAAMSTHSGSLAVGELIGAASFITAVVSGSMALVRPFEVARASFVRDILFFICAAALAMVFLLDGQLLMWECVVMIAFYLIYVVIVVAWHWVSGRRTARKLQEATARQQFATSEGDQQAEISVDRTVGARRTPSGDTSHLGHEEQFRLLEQASLDENDEELEEQARLQAIAEINQSMRVSRKRPGLRRATRNTIRPSLVGALEFRAVVASLEKSRSQQTLPINLRRYSDDPTFRQPRRQSLFSPRPTDSGVDTSAEGRAHLAPYHDTPGLAHGRNRAASANDVAALASSPARDGMGGQSGAPLHIQLPGEAGGGQSDALSPSTSRNNLLSPYFDSALPAAAGSSEHAVVSPAVIASPEPIDAPYEGSPQNPDGPSLGIHRRVSSGLAHTPGTAGSSPLLAFPPYHDDPSVAGRLSRTSSIRLPPPGLGLDLASSTDDITRPPKRISWWPYRVFPPPQELLSTFFPTLYSWPQRNAWERLIGIFAAPSVFVLTLTLPVVEDKPADEDDEYERPHTGDSNDLPSPRTTSNPPLISIEGPSEADSYQSDDDRQQASAPANHLNSPILDPSRASTPMDSDRSPPGWNRWLVCTQIIVAPLFVTVIFWANMNAELSLRALLVAELCSMIGALLVLALLLYTTSPDRTPRYRSLLSFAGFVVSVAWISTIAGEVVGILKALGVIFGISDAILGLTIFAVGNSLGDLVADVTVAKLGYPVMALGACIGGPMLNILLGIGIGGLYMTIRDGKAGDSDAPFVPYHIEVGGTLVISAIALVITLVGLLIAVPMNKWIMDRKIGLGLIAVWCVSTIINVVLEATGTVTSVAIKT